MISFSVKRLDTLLFAMFYPKLTRVAIICYIFLVLLIPIFDLAEQIVKDLHVCKETNRSIDLDLTCKDTSCVTYKNAIYQLSRFDDEFNYVYTADSKKTVVYSNHGRVYYTECETISAFEIISNFPTCSLYTAILFHYKYKQTQGFLSKQMIIRLKINSPVKCVNENEERNFGNFDSEFSIYKKGDLQTISGRNDSPEALDFEKDYEAIQDYDFIFSTALTRFLKDFFVLIMFFIALLIKLIEHRQLILKKFKKINCRRKLNLLPTMDIAEKGKNFKHMFQSSQVCASAPPLPLQNFVPAFDPKLLNTVGNTYLDPNIYHVIGQNAPASHISRSKAILEYQPRMTTRSASLSQVNEDLYEITSENKIGCPHCIKTFTTKRGLAGHMVVHM